MSNTRPRRFTIVTTDRGKTTPPEQRYEAAVTVHHADQRDPWDEVKALYVAADEHKAILAVVNIYLDLRAGAADVTT